jgi:hypothetical protein
MLKSAIQEIYKNTIDEIKEDVIDALKNESNQRNKYLFIPQKTVVNLNDLTAISLLLNAYHSYNSSSKHEYIDRNTQLYSNSLKDNLQIHKIQTGKITYENAVEIAIEAINNNIDNVYGVTFVHDGDSKTRFSNPFHPIIATRFIDEEGKDFPDVYEIIFYIWKDNLDIEIDDDIKEKIPVDIGIIIKELKDIKKTYIENSDISFKLDKNHTGIIKYKQRVFDENRNEIHNENYDTVFMVPCQIANIEGVAYPYYGSVVAENGLAFNISPLYSPNINAPLENNIRNSIEGSRVCTHSGRPYTAEGISALNHANFTSQLNSSTFKTGSIYYSKYALKFSCELYSEYLNIDVSIDEEEPVSQDKPMSFDEYKKHYPSFGATEYLKYRKEYYAKQEEQTETETEL